MKRIFLKIIIPFFIGLVGIITLVANYNEQKRFEYIDENGVEVNGVVLKIKKIGLGTTGDSWSIESKYLNDYFIKNEVVINKLNLNVGDSILIKYDSKNPRNALLELDIYNRVFTIDYLVGFVQFSIMFIGVFNLLKMKGYF